MLRAEHRLRRSQDFASTVRRGATARRSSVLVHAVVTQNAHEQAPPKVGFVVGRAVGGAVVRNAVRRRLRHLVADRVDALPAGSTVVVRAMPGAALAAHDSLAEDLTKALADATRRARSRR